MANHRIARIIARIPAAEAAPPWAPIASIVLCLLVWAAFLPAISAANPWIYSWDSVAYIETANSIHAGRGLMQRTIDGLTPDIWEPISWWPPGYPILIALVQTLGLDAPEAGVTVAVVAGGVAVVLVALICLRLFDWPLALLVALATIAMPTFLQISTQCMSDTSYYFFIVASAFCLMAWTADHSRPAAYAWIFSAGVAAGAAWSMRYAGIALFAATGLFFLIHLLKQPFWSVFRAGLVWALGVGVCAIPLIARNLSVFGAINPYHMRPSELSLWHNIRRTAKVVVEDFTTSGTLVYWIGGLGSLSLLVLASLAVLALVLIRRPSFAQATDLIYRRRVELLFLAYALIYAALVIAARTKYRWGQEIDTRHMVQTYWIIWILAATVGLSMLTQLGQSRAGARKIVSLVLLACVLVQVRSAWSHASQPAERVDVIEGKLDAAAVAYLAREVGPRQIVLATRPELLRFYGDINARKLPHVAQFSYVPPISREQLNSEGQLGFLWGIVVEELDAARRGDHDVWVKELLEDPGRYPELEQVRLPGPGLVFKYVGKR